MHSAQLLQLNKTTPRPPLPSKAFLDAVLDGLLQPQKSLPCKYLYDEQGSELFEQICDLPEYYQTRAEIEILENYGAEIAQHLGPFAELVEYGSGRSVKTRLLLHALKAPVAYIPIDISEDFLFRSAASLQREFPEILVRPVAADYLTSFYLPVLNETRRARRIFFFSGSTIGNLHEQEAIALLRRTRHMAGLGGGLLIGVDLKKDKQILEAAYNDSQGITSQFNLNLLVRINRELGANFSLTHFSHRAFYNEEKGRIEMHLVSQVAQTVIIAATPIHFAGGESIHTENSYKYSPDEFAALAARAGFSHEASWVDASNAFSLQLYR